MKFASLLLISTFALALPLASPVQAQLSGPVPDGCVRELSGKISCPPIGGEVYMTLSGQAVCGKGRCVRELSGKVTCSTQPAGQITQDVNGKITCAGGCEDASASICRQMN